MTLIWIILYLLLGTAVIGFIRYKILDPESLLTLIFLVIIWPFVVAVLLIEIVDNIKL